LPVGESDIAADDDSNGSAGVDDDDQSLASLVGMPYIPDPNSDSDDDGTDDFGDIDADPLSQNAIDGLKK